MAVTQIEHLKLIVTQRELIAFVLPLIQGLAQIETLELLVIDEKETAAFIRKMTRPGKN